MPVVSSDLVRPLGNDLQIKTMKHIYYHDCQSDTYSLDPEHNDLHLPDISIPTHPSLQSSAIPNQNQQRKERRKPPTSFCGETSHRPTCNHPENDSYLHQANSAIVKSFDTDESSTKHKKPISKLQMHLILGLCAYLPVLPLTWISNTDIPAPTFLLLATQGWLTMTLCLLSLTYINENRMWGASSW
jgi:hypothetical protein